MAIRKIKRPAKKASPAKAVGNPGEVAAVQVHVTSSDDIPQYYVNHAEVGVTQHEYVIHFAQIPAKLSPSAMESLTKDKALNVEPLLRIVLPPTMIQGLIDALTRQQDVFRTLVGRDAGVKK